MYGKLAAFRSLDQTQILKTRNSGHYATIFLAVNDAFNATVIKNVATIIVAVISTVMAAVNVFFIEAIISAVMAAVNAFFIAAVVTDVIQLLLLI